MNRNDFFFIDSSQRIIESTSPLDSSNASVCTFKPRIPRFRPGKIASIARKLSLKAFRKLKNIAYVHGLISSIIENPQGAATALSINSLTFASNIHLPTHTPVSQREENIYQWNKQQAQEEEEFWAEVEVEIKRRNLIVTPITFPLDVPQSSTTGGSIGSLGLFFRRTRTDCYIGLDTPSGNNYLEMLAHFDFKSGTSIDWPNS